MTAEYTVDGNRYTRWAAAAGQSEYSLEVDFGAATTFDTICFDVYADRADEANYEVYTDFQIQYEKDGQWVTAFDSSENDSKIRYPRFDGTEVYNTDPVWIDSRGNAKSTDYTVTFEPVTASKVRLYSDNTKKEPSILEFEVYSTKEAPTEEPNTFNLEFYLGKAQATIEDGTVATLVESAQNKFNAAVANAEAILADDTATQAEVDAAAVELRTVLNMLSMVAGIKTR